jgi:DNA-binding NtrC family response regulator
MIYAACRSRPPKEREMQASTVLVIEPDLDAANRLEKILQDRGYYVVTMPDAESALMVFEYVEPDVVLVAYPIGNRASDNIAGCVRVSRRPTTPVIGMFPYPSRSLATRALDDGCVDVIPKPIDRLLLEDLLVHVLRDTAPAQDVSKDSIRLVS